ncbi:MAG: Fic family protein [Actinomycetaceae bacterium]|nr:Fic family protein [Actinomycetaceae bacterium]
MSHDPQRPYQDLPPLPPQTELETPLVLKKTVAASRALARLDGACKRLPDPTMLINLIPLLEAQASSEIENIVTTNDELFKAATGTFTNISPQTKEALRYREALRGGFDSLPEHPITTKTALEVCSTIHGRPARIRNTPGTYIGNPATKERTYTPPEGKDTILRHMSNWEKFVHSQTDLDPLVLMAVAHYQFEAIHPFYDGNGRTGRILNLLLLIEKGLLELPIIYLSGHILRHKETYYDLLNQVTREEAWEAWILFMLAGVESTATWTLNIVEETDRLRLSTLEKIRESSPRLPATELAQLLFTQPYLRIDNVVDAGLAKRQTASSWLNELSENGVLIREKIGRHVVFVNHLLLDKLFITELPD